MAIRIRVIDGVKVALCAARSMAKEGDVYLDDGEHHALYVKFDLDFASEGKSEAIYRNSEESRIMEQEESNNPNREWWDGFYGKDEQQELRKINE